MRRSLSLHLPTALWTAMVAFLLLSPGSDAPLPPWLFWLEAPGVDKLIHCALFFGQGWLVARSLGRGTWLAAVLAAGYGLLLELAQLGVPGRGFAAGDVVANLVGAALGAFARIRGRGARPID